MSSSSDETTGSDDSGTEDQIGISDDQLPADLVPDEDNPLAEGLESGETVEGLLEDGKRSEESGESSGSGDSSGSEDSSAD